LKNLQNAKVVSSWFNGIQGKVNAVGLYGNRVNLDDAFDFYKKTGKLSALTIEVILPNEETPVEIMITKSAGVVLYTNWNQKQDLDFLFEFKSLLLFKEINVAV
jgi:hypothetical protein